MLADKSMTIRLAGILKTIEKMSKPAARNDDQVRPLLTDTFKKQVDVTLALHLSNMKSAKDDDDMCYKNSDKLRENIWDKYSLDALNTAVRDNYANTLSLKEQCKEKISVPVELHFKSFTDDIPAETKTNKGEKYLDSGHMNVFLLIPLITTILHAKLQNKPLRSMVNNKGNARIISYICRFQYQTKAVTNNKVHPALNLYGPSSSGEFKKDFFINSLSGNDQVVPVLIFLVSMFNACMLYQKDKITNLLIPTLQRFDMIGKVSDSTFIDTLSEYL